MNRDKMIRALAKNEQVSQEFLIWWDSLSEAEKAEEEQRIIDSVSDTEDHDRSVREWMMFLGLTYLHNREIEREIET